MVPSILKHKFKLKKDKAGMSSLEMIAVFMVFMLMVAFFFDTFTVLNQHYVASREANIITRQIAVQGGVSTSEPANLTRMGQQYQTSRSINHRVRERLGGMGIEDFNLYVQPHEEGVTTGWYELTPATILTIPYQENFEFILEYEYEWQLLGQLIPGMGGTRTRTIQRSAVSEI